MLFETYNHILIFRANRFLTAGERILNTAEFLIAYLILFVKHDNANVNIFLARLPLLLSEQLQGDFRYVPGRRQRHRLARLHKACGASLHSSGAVNLRLPPTQDVAGLFLARNASRSMGERIHKHQDLLAKGKDEFDRFLSVWCADAERSLSQTSKVCAERDNVCVELINLGFALRALVLDPRVHCRSAYARVALCVYRIYGEDSGLDFWRLANFPLQCWPYHIEKHFTGSVVQKILQM
ncbi:P0 protein [Beet western yellows virus]|uniref:p0 protein n=1 Tax=Beet western yellows virus TaxID=12042 RepID=Q8JZ12_9VIRU|nr:P0 protein [Beet western yellows virus]AAM22677.1 P0 protein [Beet western yellows virus]